MLRRGRMAGRRAARVVREQQESLMRNRTAIALAATLALLAPAAASADASASAPWSLTLGVWGGVTRYDVLGLQHGIGTLEPEDAADLLEGKFDTWGGSAVLRLGWFDVGLLYERTPGSGGAESAVLTPVAGFAWNLAEALRLDLLGELGGHQISNIGTSGSFDVSNAETVWLPYVGVRPTLSLRLPLGPLRAIVSLAAFARWDLVKKEVTVEVTSGTTTTFNTYEAGGATLGLVLGAGIEI
jgi:hypothetical protein